MKRSSSQSANSAEAARQAWDRYQSLPTRVTGIIAGDAVTARWIGDTGDFWYVRNLGAGRHQFIHVDATGRKQAPAFDHAAVAGLLTRELGRTVEADLLPIEFLHYSDAGELSVQAEGRVFSLKGAAGPLVEEPGELNSLKALDPAHGPTRSGTAGGDTSVTFVNRTDEPCSVWWLDGAGNRRSYGQVEPGRSKTQHTFAGHVWLITSAENVPLAVFRAEPLAAAAVVTGPVRDNPEPRAAAGYASPDGKWRALVKDHNLWLTDAGSGAQSQLSADGSAANAYTEPVVWSPDSRSIALYQTEPEQEHLVSFVQSSPTDQLQPKLHQNQYLKPGDRVAHRHPRLYRLDRKAWLPIEESEFPNPYELGDLHWEPESRFFTFLYNQRGHQALRIIAVDARTGAVRVVVDESSPTFIDYAGKYAAEYLYESGELIWMSERSGWNHLYLYDLHTGRVKNPITQGNWVVRSVTHVDPIARTVDFVSNGNFPGQDPYFLQHWRVKLDGTQLTWLTHGAGTHKVQFSPNRQLFVDTWSRVDSPPVSELRSGVDGTLVMPLDRAVITSRSRTGWQPPEPFVAKGRDGETDIYGVIYRPTSFDARRKYPVLEAIYAGPQDAYVPKAFSPFHQPQQFAELGFIVVQIDGMGTNWRSKAFHNVCWKNLADAGFPDRILWIRAAAAKYRQMDLQRVGIYGGSAGGQNAARALMAHGDFYHVAVADCGCHDNRMDKIWWNELWMGWPVGPQYAASSNVVDAHNLRGRLLLMVGEMDTNVDPASTMQVVNALIRANKPFEMLVVPGSDHGSAETPYGTRVRAAFLARQLLGLEIPAFDQPFTPPAAP
ncbi:MAG: DPP IV N-terminal domain-containing protein [Armatimonadetes bacterium]|nr:DPP IV N-terminal domain-containing protein [Armatimonadota bacterium]MDE2205995.1 DPP IV N-terminal domain-containing protein [Armatimonadota bacterium]